MSEQTQQCRWLCPTCSSRCGGVLGHDGEHQCPIHYRSLNSKNFEVIDKEEK